MFDPSVYKDEWTPRTSSSQTSNSKADDQTSQSASSSKSNHDYWADLFDPKNNDFRHFDGSKAEMNQNVSDKYDKSKLGQDQDKTEQEIDRLAKELIDRNKKDNTHKSRTDHAFNFDQPQDFSDDPLPGLKADSTNDSQLEQNLDAKTEEAVKKIEAKKENKIKEEEQIKKEISDLDHQIEDIRSAAEELKTQIKQFDTKLEEIK